MQLTQVQLQVIKTWIIANHNSVYDQSTVTALNAIASPAYTVWKTSVALVKIGDRFNGAELGGLTTANHTRLQTILQISGMGVNPTLPDRRAFFDDVFSGAGGTITRANLATLWKRSATVAEKLLATGTGTVASPSTLGSQSINDETVYAEGPVTLKNVIDSEGA